MIDYLYIRCDAWSLSQYFMVLDSVVNTPPHSTSFLPWEARPEHWRRRPCCAVLPYTPLACPPPPPPAHLHPRINRSLSPNSRPSGRCCWSSSFWAQVAGRSTQRCCTIEGCRYRTKSPKFISTLAPASRHDTVLLCQDTILLAEFCTILPGSVCYAKSQPWVDFYTACCHLLQNKW